MQIWKIAFGFAAFLVLAGAAPSQSGYGNIQKKKEALGSKDDLVKIREEAVKPQEVAKNGVQEFALIATDAGYLPSRIIVRNKIPVYLYITSASARTLCFMMDDFSIRKGVENQQAVQVNFVPNKTGTYKFYCPVNEIQGSLVVRD